MYIHGHHFYNYLKCKHRIYLDLYGNPRERDKESPFVEMLWEKGVRHEVKIIKKIAKKKKVVEVKTKNLKQGYKKTLRLMKQGVDFIYQGILFSGDNVGKPDLLEKTKGHSIFGNYFYLPIDIKSGHGLHHKKSGDEVKKEYAFQVMHYLDLLKEIQGFRPRQGKIINSDGQVLYFDYQDYFDKYQSVKSDLSLIVNQKKSYEPVIGGHCRLCHWQTHCLKWARKNRDLSLIFGLGEKKYSLRNNNIKTIKDLADLDISKFLSLSSAEDLRGIGLKSLKAWQRRAQVQLSNKEIIYKKIIFPKVRYEIFFDLEDDPTQNITYLYGIIERDTTKNTERYLKFLTEKPEEEASVFINFLNYIDSLKDFIIYHYHHRERTMLEYLLKKYHLPRRLYLKFCNHSRDLYQDIVRYTDWPTYSYSLKIIANYLGFKWSVEDPSGANSIAWYNKYLEDPIKNKKYLDKIIQYNQEDCLATAIVKNFLSKNL